MSDLNIQEGHALHMIKNKSKVKKPDSNPNPNPYTNNNQ